MVNGEPGIMFYSGLRVLLSLFNSPISQQMALTSVFPLREETKQNKGSIRNEKHKNLKRTDSKRKVPIQLMAIPALGGRVRRCARCEITCWQPHYGTVAVQRRTVETS